MLGDNVPRIALAGAINSRNGPVCRKFGEGQVVLCSAVSIPPLVLLFLSLDKFNKGIGRARVQQVDMNGRRRLCGGAKSRRPLDSRGCGHGQCRFDTTASPSPVAVARACRVQNFLPNAFVHCTLGWGVEMLAVGENLSTLLDAESRPRNAGEKDHGRFGKVTNGNNARRIAQWGPGAHFVVARPIIILVREPHAKYPSLP